MISIIGAGPIGCYAGYLLAKEGYTIDIYEEHSEIGKPVQCAGLLAEDINNLVKLDEELIANKISRIKIISPDKSELDIATKEIVLDREKFDKHLAQIASDAGCNIHLGSRFENNKINGKTLKSEILIGADGPFSRVADSAGILKPRKYQIGMQVRAEHKTDIEEYKVIIKDFPGFAWVIPESENISRIGLLTNTNPAEHFNKLLKEIKPKKILESNSGLIPIHDPKLEIQKNNIYLIGDAATQVKTSTAGGIIPGLKAATHLCKAITKDLNYSNLCMKDIGKQLKTHLLIRNILNKFSQSDYNDLVKMLDKPNIKDLFKNISREKPSLLLPKLMLRQPKLLKYFKCLI
ncbi:NAD(P)/FAD-dependent oxidoreductase [Candidatus Woesearchaeota archaeon]|nr:NAD(P)/FAD-dependent oxidoreductase [Candidatus Woesearchaeota archaeon]